MSLNLKIGKILIRIECVFGLFVELSEGLDSKACVVVFKVL